MMALIISKFSLKLSKYRLVSLIVYQIVDND